uniref:Uncharacterized protein n=1 Tax=Amphilophus citrinellus TaxID=61819 RepID=A0A3Q0SI15_AMPCI
MQILAGPPTYDELEKSASDVLTKGYGFGLINLNLETKSENGLEFSSTGWANTETTGSCWRQGLETKYSRPERLRRELEH